MGDCVFGFDWPVPVEDDPPARECGTCRHRTTCSDGSDACTMWHDSMGFWVTCDEIKFCGVWEGACRD